MLAVGMFVRDAAAIYNPILHCLNCGLHSLSRRELEKRCVRLDNLDVENPTGFAISSML